MKQPKKINERHTLCCSCRKPIHIDELGGISKEGLFHNNITCAPKRLTTQKCNKKSEDQKCS